MANNAVKLLSEAMPEEIDTYEKVKNYILTRRGSPDYVQAKQEEIQSRKQQAHKTVEDFACHVLRMQQDIDAWYAWEHRALGRDGEAPKHADSSVVPWICRNVRETIRKDLLRTNPKT